VAACQMRGRHFADLGLDGHGKRLPSPTIDSLKDT
jgi:hypothetical protein